MLLKSFILLSLVFTTIAVNNERRSPNFSHRRKLAAGTARNHKRSTNKTAVSSCRKVKFKQEVVFKGDDFFKSWDFFTGEDPTHGLVNYQNRGDAQSKGLAFIDDNAVVLKVDDKTVLKPGSKRDSIRITSKQSWNSGLFIADFQRMPVGCSIWPAYWSFGPDWPKNGEIDVLEGVHNQQTNQYTLHTSEGCTASTNSRKVLGQAGNTQCATINGDNTGCSFHDTDTRSYGNCFNEVDGGIFAHLWNSEGISIWHFARDDIPQDIKDEKPNPDSWGPPVAFWSGDSCPIAEHFRDHSLVIDTTLCGDFAGATYKSVGCPGTCEEAVADPNNFKNAVWRINSISVYQPA